jgi:hypothetical protein
MHVLVVIAAILAALVLGLALLVFVLRVRHRVHARAVREAIRAYVASRGGTVTFDDQGMVVKGPRGEGRERLTALMIMCKPENRGRWESTIGFSLRKYIPDATDDLLAKRARERLDKALPAIQALSDEQLRERLRIRIVLQRSSSEGLATCALPIGDHEARVVLDGFDLAGLPTSARARLAETDEALRELALSAMLGEPPAVTAGAASSHAWLCRPERIFGADPFLIVCEGEGLAWLAARRGTTQKALAALAARATASGPMTNVMFAWDGTTLTEVPVLVHTIIGPTTPDYTLTLPTAIIYALGVVAGADGRIGVRC